MYGAEQSEISLIICLGNCKFPQRARLREQTTFKFNKLSVPDKYAAPSTSIDTLSGWVIEVYYWFGASKVNPPLKDDIYLSLLELKKSLPNL